MGREVYLALGALLLSTPSIGQTISYVYPTTGRPHAPVADTYYQYSYDANGNMTQITHPQKTVSFAYNHLNKLKETRDGAIITRYAYDTNGTRIAKLINGEVSERYFGPIEKKNNQIITYYFVGGKRVAEKSESGQMSYYHQDHLGSTSLVTNASGNEIRWTDYYEFGAVRTERGPKDVDYMYNDKRRDKETDFYDYGARAYAAKMFKFTTPDSIVPDPTNPQSFNRYAYVRNNPLKYVDPTGHADVPAAPPVDLPITSSGTTMAQASAILSEQPSLLAGVVAGVLDMGSKLGMLIGQGWQGSSPGERLEGIVDGVSIAASVAGPIASLTRAPAVGAMGPELAALGGGGRASTISAKQLKVLNELNLTPDSVLYRGTKLEYIEKAGSGVRSPLNGKSMGTMTDALGTHPDQARTLYRIWGADGEFSNQVSMQGVPSLNFTSHLPTAANYARDGAIMQVTVRDALEHGFHIAPDSASLFGRGAQGGVFLYPRAGSNLTHLYGDLVETSP